MKFDSFAIIKKSFETLTETCLLENIKYEHINIGSPSLLLKLWKKGKVDKVTTVYLGDLKDYKQKPWLKIYAKDLIPCIKKINTKIVSNEKLSNVLKGETEKLKKNLGLVQVSINTVV